MKAGTIKLQRCTKCTAQEENNGKHYRKQEIEIRER